MPEIDIQDSIDDGVDGAKNTFSKLFKGNVKILGREYPKSAIILVSGGAIATLIIVKKMRGGGRDSNPYADGDVVTNPYGDFTSSTSDDLSALIGESSAAVEDRLTAQLGELGNGLLSIIQENNNQVNADIEARLASMRPLSDSSGGLAYSESGYSDIAPITSSIVGASTLPFGGSIPAQLPQPLAQSSPTPAASPTNTLQSIVDRILPRPTPVVTPTTPSVQQTSILQNLAQNLTSVVKGASQTLQSALSPQPTPQQASILQNMAQTVGNVGSTAKTMGTSLQSSLPIINSPTYSLPTPKGSSTSLQNVVNQVPLPSLSSLTPSYLNAIINNNRELYNRIISSYGTSVIERIRGGVGAAQQQAAPYRNPLSGIATTAGKK